MDLVTRLANLSFDALARAWADDPPSPNAVFAWSRGQHVAGFVAGYAAALDDVGKYVAGVKALSSEETP